MEKKGNKLKLHDFMKDTKVGKIDTNYVRWRVKMPDQVMLFKIFNIGCKK